MKRKIYTQLVDWKNQERRKNIGIKWSKTMWENLYSKRIRPKRV